jgi:hypothetical protein
MNDLKTFGNANMGIDGVRPSLFPPEYRASALLLHVTSIPSKDGIGDVGPEALVWIDLFAGEVHSAAAASPRSKKQR